MTKRRESHIRDFALLFTGQTVSQLGTSMTSFALIEAVKNLVSLESESF